MKNEVALLDEKGLMSQVRGQLSTVDSLNKYKLELLDKKKEWEDFIKDHPLYLELKDLEDHVKMLESQHKDEELEIINFMLCNDIEEFKNDDIRIKVANTGRPSVEVVDIEEVPEQFMRVKKEVDKNAVMELYKKNKIIVQGTNIKDKPNYKLNIKLLGGKK